MSSSSAKQRRLLARPPQPWLPDFCRAPAVLAAVVITGLVVVVIHIARGLPPGLGLLSLLAQSIALMAVVVLCGLRQPLNRLPPVVGGLVAQLVLMLICAAAASAAWVLDRQLGLLVEPARFSALLAGCLGIGGVVGAAALRYLYIRAQWQHQLRAKEHARFMALQARIRPHFLFNTINVIASLTRRDPAQAETAIEDLADLFRAALAEHESMHPLADELALIDGYLRIETLRLADRLNIVRDYPDRIPDVYCPPLVIEPLVENAIYHGIQNLPDGGTVHLRLRCTTDELTFEVTNPVATTTRPGNGLALDNIRQRLGLTYGGSARLHTVLTDGHYLAALTLPMDDDD